VNYTIATMEDLHHNIIINFDLDGNKYMIGIYHVKKGEYTHKTFDTLGRAYKAFETLSRAIIEGTHSYEQRKEMLENQGGKNKNEKC
jgi:predicted patatin/cPLA2 family phospholipase